MKTRVTSRNKKKNCVNVLKKTAIQYFRNVNIKDINNNKKLWKSQG